MTEFAQKLLSWYDQCGRDLPWRRTRDPYRIWLSEIILQQTRIAQGTAYWERFVERFPDVEALAAASEDEVLRLWQGLGYYSRARNLHAAARQIVALGAFPSTLEGIRALKGVGDYTAAAIASFAFGIPAAVVDGNVYRVLSRVYGIETPIGSTEARKQFNALAQSLLSPERPGDHNQAMMDFGATWCTPQRPVCADGGGADCPFAEQCVAFRTGRVDALPVRKAKPVVRERWFTYIYIRCAGMTAIHRRGPGDIWQGLWEPLLIEGRDVMPDPSAVMPGPSSVMPGPSSVMPGPSAVMPGPCAVMHGLRAVMHGPRAVMPDLIGHLSLLRSGIRHQLTHQTLHAALYLLETDERPPLPGGFIWIPEAALGDYALPRLVERLLA